jgi:hypothetical protein
MPAFSVYLSAIPQWRISDGVSLDDTPGWKETRLVVLERDAYTCQGCGFMSPAWMEVHHADGDYKNNSVDNLVTLCPFCHSCFHIGFAGLKEKGILLQLEFPIEQASIHKILLDSLWQMGDTKGFPLFLQKLPILHRWGSDQLMDLANLMILNMRMSKKASVPKNLVFFPNPKKYDICSYIIRRKEYWESIYLSKTC